MTGLRSKEQPFGVICRLRRGWWQAQRAFTDGLRRTRQMMDQEVERTANTIQINLSYCYMWYLLRWKLQDLLSKFPETVLSDTCFSKPGRSTLQRDRSRSWSSTSAFHTEINSHHQRYRN